MEKILIIHVRQHFLFLVILLTLAPGLVLWAIIISMSKRLRADYGRCSKLVVIIMMAMMVIIMEGSSGWKHS